jgi:hypothetical protein
VSIGTEAVSIWFERVVLGGRQGSVAAERMVIGASAVPSYMML